MSHAKLNAVGIRAQVKAMGWNFWVANMMEALERLAFFAHFQTARPGLHRPIPDGKQQRARASASSTGW
jgi:hypothetical protein